MGRNPKNGKNKGGIKAHTILKATENMPCLIRYSEAARHTNMFLEEVMNLPIDSTITIEKGYVDYVRYEAFSEKLIWYVTHLKKMRYIRLRK